MVHILLTKRHRRLFSTIAFRILRAAATRRPFATRFACASRRGAYNSVPLVTTTSRADTVTHHVHRFSESIAGRNYLIEVSAISKDRWRADIVRIPGVPTALMPFYGRTPAEAARQLSDWLTRAHGRAADS